MTTRTGGGFGKPQKGLATADRNVWQETWPTSDQSVSLMGRKLGLRLVVPVLASTMQDKVPANRFVACNRSISGDTTRRPSRIICGSYQRFLYPKILRFASQTAMP
ncbi:hypothetical protein [Rhizobium sp. CF142]|uniref:hypothetical protein n=1 Tax=Rhizobium sp. CF142 TaxID=1144314 RepID=UPI0012F68343|nr:hypothetical protein [Rhizobium sp. CF142]